MSQEHHVLKCFSCETFQVHIVKKVNKWECKICGAKQSVKRNYGKGTAKDCRLHVMKLNELRFKNAETSGQTEDEIFEGLTDSFEETPVKETNKARGSKWDKYLEDSTNDESDADDAVPDYFLEEEKRKRVKNFAECYPQNKKVCLEASTSEIFSESCKETIPTVISPKKNFYKSPVTVCLDANTSEKKLSESFKETIPTVIHPEEKFYKSPVKVEAKLQESKYAKYVDKEEADKDELIQQDKYLNIFDSEPIDLDAVLNFE